MTMMEDCLPWPQQPWPEKVYAARNAGLLIVGRSTDSVPSVLLGGRFYSKRQEYSYTDFGGGLEWRDAEPPLLGACREFAEELFAQCGEEASATAATLAAALDRKLVGGRPFLYRNYVMFVVTAEAVASSLGLVVADSALDCLAEAAKFEDSRGMANPEMDSVAVIPVAELLRGARVDGMVQPLYFRSQEGSTVGGPVQLRPVMAGAGGSINAVREVLEEFAWVAGEKVPRTSLVEKIPSRPDRLGATEKEKSSSPSYSQSHPSAAPKRRWQKSAKLTS
mmetsp:Transcript_196/g.478  ORF Transcript_196/g.478 Transcript_196/m.478 type:complete len:279 (-) Transcript_196:56-892(-)